MTDLLILLLILALVVLVVGLLRSARGQRTARRPTREASTDPAQFKDLSGTPLNDQSVQAALDYAREHNGHALLILHQGRLVLEDYHNGLRKEEAHRLASGTKSFSGILLAALIHDGRVSSFDERVSDTIIEWQGDPAKARITLRDLLTLSSGLDAGDIGRVPTYAEAVGARITRAPGTFEYGPVPFQVFGEVVRRKLGGESPVDYLRRRIFAPIGLEVTSWRTGPDGHPHMSSGAELRASEWAKFGELLRQKGAWNGRSLVDRKLVEELTRPSHANSAYGITLWLAMSLAALEDDNGAHARQAPRRRTRDRDLGASRPLPYAVYAAAGAGKQRLYVVEELGLVIVRFGDKGPFGDERFFGLLLGLPVGDAPRHVSPRRRRKHGLPRSTRWCGTVTGGPG
jgi:CubicO group peptidase (beta-lactamase class C family)